jgi:hypothetical protein
MTVVRIGLATCAALFVCTAATGSASNSARSCDVALVQVASASPGRARSVLSGVDALSGQVAWAAGSFAHTSGGREHPLLEHWNGSAWAAVALPRLAKRADAAFSDVGIVSPSNVWAVGQISTPGARDARSLIEHWTGAHAHVVKSPSPGNFTTLDGMSVLSASSIWAVGAQEQRHHSRTPLVEHWDGNMWRVVLSPTIRNGELIRIDAISKSDVWAVGYRGEPNRALVEHWDGHRWRVVNLSDPLPVLFGVGAAGSDEVWAGGATPDEHPAVEHWDGNSWAGASLPAAAGLLFGVSAATADDVWAVGGQGDTGEFAFRQTLAYHWNGAAWETAPSASPSASYNLLVDVAALPGKQVWAVGAYDVGTGPSTPGSHLATLVEGSALCS